MLRTTPLLIVMVLAGDPTGSLACELWCSTPAAQDHHRAIGCHDASRHSPQGRQIASITPTADCLDAAVVTPFVAEARQTESDAAAAPPTLFEFGSNDPDHDEIAADWWVFKVPPRRPSSSSAVLRV